MALEDRLHMLRRMNSQLERSQSDAQLQSATAQQQVSIVDTPLRIFLSGKRRLVLNCMGLSLSISGVSVFWEEAPCCMAHIHR